MRNGERNVAYTLREAALAVRKSKPTVLRAIQAGKLSAVRDAMGGWLIEPAELHRIYPPASPVMVREVGDETGVLRREMEVLREERERERHEAQATIADLRRRLDSADEERRRLTAVLADQRKGRGWWPWKRS